MANCCILPGLNAVHSKIFKNPPPTLLHFARKTKLLICTMKNISFFRQPSKIKPTDLFDFAMLNAVHSSQPSKIFKNLQTYSKIHFPNFCILQGGMLLIQVSSHTGLAKSKGYQEHPYTLKGLQNQKPSAKSGPRACKTQNLPQMRTMALKPKVSKSIQTKPNPCKMQNLPQNADHGHQTPKLARASKPSQTLANCKTFHKRGPWNPKASKSVQTKPNPCKMQNLPQNDGHGPKNPKASKSIQTKPNPCEMPNLPQNEDHGPKAPRLARASKESQTLSKVRNLHKIRTNGLQNQKPSKSIHTNETCKIRNLPQNQDLRLAKCKTFHKIRARACKIKKLKKLARAS